jgi:hypothetical protein
MIGALIVHTKAATTLHLLLNKLHKTLAAFPFVLRNQYRLQ